MQRNYKFLGSALALATFSLICLEVSNADEATQNAAAPPAAEVAPSETAPAVFAAPRVQTLVTIRSAINPRTPTEVVLDIVQSPAGEIQQFFYHPVGRTYERTSCTATSSSRANCLISLAEATSSHGVTLERMTVERGKFHRVVALHADDDFSPTDGGRITLEYVDNIPDLTAMDSDAEGEIRGDVKGHFEMNLRKLDGRWVLSSPNGANETPFNTLQFLTRMRRSFFGAIPCGIQQIVPSTR